jgi:hypothetical protein
VSTLSREATKSALLAYFGSGTDVNRHARICRLWVTSGPACAGAISFPLPHPLGLIDAYTVYVGFDPVRARTAGKEEGACQAPPSRRQSRTRQHWSRLGIARRRRA